MQTAVVTGSTGLLGNNLVGLLAGRGVRIKALARSREKAAMAGRHRDLAASHPHAQQHLGITIMNKRLLSFATAAVLALAAAPTLAQQFPAAAPPSASTAALVGRWLHDS